MTIRTSKTYHKSVNARVDQDKHPDGRAHVAHACPHAHHCAGMVVGLKGGAALALHEDDHGVDNFVEFAEVEEPAPEGEAFIPESTKVCAVGCQVIVAQVNETVVGRPG